MSLLQPRCGSRPIKKKDLLYVNWTRLLRHKKKLLTCLKKIWSVGSRNFFIFSYFFFRKERSGLYFYENMGILLRVSALLFYFAFLLIKK